jgi:hypothetical protein
MNTRTLVQLLLAGAMLAVEAGGCRRDPVLGALKRFDEYAKEKGGDVEKQRAALALSMCQNHRLDGEPILLVAQLGKPTGTEIVKLNLLTFDEDQDIIGLVIVEEYIDANGLKTTLTEEYPALGPLMDPKDGALQLLYPTVQIRSASQRKDVEQWKEYVNAKPMNIHARRDEIPSGYRWPDMPPIWISIPEPNHVDVHAYIYDQEGHKSDRLRVANFPPQGKMRDMYRMLRPAD